MAGESAHEGLHALLKEQRDRLISCWSAKIVATVASAALPRAELLDHIPAFVDEIIGALYPEAVPFPVASANAVEHGEQRLGLGFDAGEVVREYGMLHECILELASEAGLTVSPREQATIVRWLNAGIADAIAQYVTQRDLELQRETSEHLGFIAHELRNPLGAARLALQRLRQSELGEGRIVATLDRNLRRTSEMIDSVLNHAALKMGITPKLAPIPVRSFLHELEGDGSIEADNKGIKIVVAASQDLSIRADPRLLRSAISNLLQNAVKFSRDGSSVTVAAAQSEGRVTIEVSDACGGLPPGKADELFTPLVQRSGDRSGFGLGLAIALQAAEAHNGTVKVRDRPGIGCTFIIDLPSIPA